MLGLPRGHFAELGGRCRQHVLDPLSGSTVLNQRENLGMKIVRNLTAMAAVAAALTIAAQARADIITFFLNQPECTGSCTTAPPLIRTRPQSR